jgi:hypothetical protein
MGDSEMTDQSRQRGLRQAIAAAVSERAGAESQRPQKQVGRWETETERETVGRARPLEFDTNGFPVAQRNPSSAARVARLLHPL